MGRSASKGEVNENFQVLDYPGRSILHGSRVPGKRGRYPWSDDPHPGGIRNEKG